MRKIGIAGFGFMGRMHYKCYQALDGVEVTAVCDANPNIEEDTKQAVGNIGDAQQAIDFSSFQLYADFEKMLSDAKLDAVSITLPTYLHADYSIKALQAGLDVMCEKPMALNVEDWQSDCGHLSTPGSSTHVEPGQLVHGRKTQRRHDSGLAYP